MEQSVGNAKKTVMIVEDDAVISELLSTLLILEGVAVISVSNGIEALKKLEAGPMPNLILTDMKMHGMNGDELADRVHLDSRTKNIPMVLTSGVADICERAKKMGAQGFLRKPYAIESFLSLVHSLA